MTVEQLIEQLMLIPEDYVVVVYDDLGYASTVKRILTETSACVIDKTEPCNIVGLVEY